MESISQRMELLNQSHSVASQKSGSIKVVNNGGVDFYKQKMASFQAGFYEEVKGSGRPLHTEDNEALTIEQRKAKAMNIKSPKEPQPNGFDDMQDFDDLPSVKSRDLISRADEESMMSMSQKNFQITSQLQFVSTPRNEKEESNLDSFTPKIVHKETPVIEKRKDFFNN